MPRATRVALRAAWRFFLFLTHRLGCDSLRLVLGTFLSSFQGGQFYALQKGVGFPCDLLFAPGRLLGSGIEKRIKRSEDFLGFKKKIPRVKQGLSNSGPLVNREMVPWIHH